MCKVLITFKHSRAAIKADNLLKLSKINAQVVATPGDISSECGMSLVVNCEHRSEIEKMLNIEKIEFVAYDRSSAQ